LIFANWTTREAIRIHGGRAGQEIVANALAEHAQQRVDLVSFEGHIVNYYIKRTRFELRSQGGSVVAVNADGFARLRETVEGALAAGQDRNTETVSHKCVSDPSTQKACTADYQHAAFAQAAFLLCLPPVMLSWNSVGNGRSHPTRVRGRTLPR